MADSLDRRLDDALGASVTSPGDDFIGRVRTRRRRRRATAGVGGLVVVLAVGVLSWPRGGVPVTPDAVMVEARPASTSLAALQASWRAGSLPDDTATSREEPIRAGSRPDPEVFINSL